MVWVSTESTGGPIIGALYRFCLLVATEPNFYRPARNAKYKNIDPLFSSEAINWKLIETHWQDMMQVVLSVSAGKISSSLLLRKLGSYSRKNKLYYAFQELGRVVRTQFLLEYIC